MTEKEAIALHVAGATVRHTSPFEDLPSPERTHSLTQEFIDRWVRPYYLDFPKSPAQIDQNIESELPHITKDICVQLLGDFNWRTRSVGACFAAIKGYTDLIDIIGIHLLKSEVCFAGQDYAKVLAYFNTPACVKYLDDYLTYYLGQSDLRFDQIDVMGALAYLDDVNNTQVSDRHIDAFNDLMKCWEGNGDYRRTKMLVANGIETFNALRELDKK